MVCITRIDMLSRRQLFKWAGVSLATLSWFSTDWSTSSEELKKSVSVTDVSLEVKIGQMLMVGFRGLSVNSTHPIVEDIQRYYVGGVVLFDYDFPSKTAVRNIKSRSQVKQLVTDLQSSAKIPLVVAIDYEGGKVNRLNEQYGFPPTVSAKYLGEKDDLRLTYKYASDMAQTLVGMSINLNFAPVVDVNINPQNPVIAKRQRSFSANPDVVIRHAREFIRAHHDHGIFCSLKHFPGHGSSGTDSHLEMTNVTKTWSPLKELAPYSNLIQAGLADVIMTAHVFNQTLDPDYPATLSKPTITGLLRGDKEYVASLANPKLTTLLQQMPLNYEGVVFSDDIRMRAIADHYDFKVAIAKAIEAGVDIILLGNNTNVFEENLAARAVTVIKQLVEEETISEARIEASYRRIMGLKGRLKR
jgi:beta-N-acetylhexosaminidase